MKYIISEEILKKSKCDKDFICQKKNARENMCKIHKCIDNQYCLLRESKPESCINKFSFGYTDICKCPARIEILKKYGV